MTSVARRGGTDRHALVTRAAAAVRATPVLCHAIPRVGSNGSQGDGGSLAAEPLSTRRQSGTDGSVTAAVPARLQTSRSPRRRRSAIVRWEHCVQSVTANAKNIIKIAGSSHAASATMTQIMRVTPLKMWTAPPERQGGGGLAREAVRSDGTHPKRARDSFGGRLPADWSLC